MLPPVGYVDILNPGGLLEPVCCKKQQKKFLTSYWFVEQGTSERPEGFQADSK